MATDPDATINETDPRFATLDIMGATEARALLNLPPGEFRRLQRADPSFPLATRLKIGEVWSGQAMRDYDTERRKLGLYRVDAPPR